MERGPWCAEAVVPAKAREHAHASAADFQLKLAPHVCSLDALRTWANDLFRSRRSRLMQRGHRKTSIPRCSGLSEHREFGAITRVGNKTHITRSAGLTQGEVCDEVSTSSISAPSS